MAMTRQTIERSWVIGVVVFVTVRFVATYSVIAAEDRMTVVVFGLLDIGTAVPYAIGIARLVTSLVDRRPALAARWGIIASVSFLAPYAWLAWRGRDGQFPTMVYVAIALFVICLGANAVITVRRRVVEGRREAGDEHAPSETSTAPDEPEWERRRPELGSARSPLS